MIYSIGHSILKEQPFVTLMGPAHVLIDVRSHPGSRAHPQFNRPEMERWMPEMGKTYEWWPGLGGWDVRHAQDVVLREKMAARGVDLRCYARGLFPKERIAGTRQPDLFGGNADMLAGKPTWTSQGLHDYSYFAMLDEFRDSLLELVRRGEKEHVALCCCECLWWKCHRSMVADALHFRGVGVLHIMPNGVHKWHAASIGNRIERYPAEVIETWKSWM